MTQRQRIWAGMTLFAIIFLLAYIRFALPFMPMYGKGGMGIAGAQAYVVTNGDVNVALCGNSRWSGRRRQEKETITCGTDRVLPFRLSMLADRPLIVRFTPDRIYVFDTDKFDGGYYLRD